MNEIPHFLFVLNDCLVMRHLELVEFIDLPL